MPRLLIVHHSPTASLQRLTDAVIAGANDDAITGVDVIARPALEATADDVLESDGYVLLTGANFGYMSGGLKVFFDSTFLRIGGALDASGGAGETVGPTARRPYGLLVHGRYDTVGAVRSVQSIVGALGWKQAAAVVDVMGDVTDADLGAATELGGTVAALLMT
jgi:multimeric flavodoxin WrbA